MPMHKLAIPTLKLAKALVFYGNEGFMYCLLPVTGLLVCKEERGKKH